MFEDLIEMIEHTDRILCVYITTYDKQKTTYADDAVSGGVRAIRKNATKSALQPLGATLNFIYCWIEHFQHNYQVILIIYHEAMINYFK